MATPSPRRKSFSRYSNPSQMAGMPNQPQRPSVYAGPQSQGTPPMANGRRMTSGPMAPGQGPMMNGPPPSNDHSSPQTSQGPPQRYNQPQQVPHPHPQQTPQQRIPSNSSPVVPSSHPPPSQAQQPSQPSALVNQTSYPWMTRQLGLYTPQTSPPSAPQSPFPRYGLSVPAFPSHSGHMLIFGGLVHERVRNDLWSMDIRSCETLPVKTKGDAPIPRVGHAAAMADRIMIVWGGDTKVNVDDPQDEGLYILDLRSQEWTSLPVQKGPVGRYGHAVCLVDGKFYVFGGQADGAFMNDLWMYDIKQLSGATHKWEQIQYTTPAPPRRTGHIFVAGNNGKLYLFGGTDGNYHYNDTWSFDVATGAWSELSCIGYIPLPREGHAAAIVDDTIYVFGGRDVKGKDLGDLAAFKLSNQRWYMFQNMGPVPTARSGHAMVAAAGKIFVVGGEANQALTDVRDDPSLIHILDTGKIKYPPESQPPRNPSSLQNHQSPTPNQPQSSQDQTQRSSQRGEDTPPKNGQQRVNETPQSVKRGLPNSGSMDSLARAASPPATGGRLPPNIQPLGATLPRSESGDLGQGQATPRANGNAGPPQRPRREGDEEYRRAMSPTNGPASPSNVNFQANRVTSPTHNGPASPPSNVKTGFNPSVLGTRSPSPRLRMLDGERPAPPPDAFYYGRSPTSANGFGNARPSSLSGAQDLLREIKAKEHEIDLGKKRELALKVILARAVQQGFVTGEEENVELPEKSEESGEKEKELIHKLTDALVRLKQDKASIQNDMLAQIRLASDKAMEAERLRRGALQEAAFYRAKIATLESNSPIDLARIEKERIVELEKQIGIISSAHASSQKELDSVSQTVNAVKSLHSAATERESETLKRAEEAEDAHREAVEEIEQLHEKLLENEQTLREHTEKLITLSSTVQQREAEKDHLQTQLDEAIAGRDENIGLIEQAQSALKAAGVRTTEMEGLYEKANSRVSTLEEELAEVKAELEIKTRDAEISEEKYREVENAWTQSREEADSLRAVTTSRLGEILDSHKEMRADESRYSRGYTEQIKALEQEVESLRKMLKEAGQRVDSAESGVSNHRSKSRELEGKLQALRGELRGSKTKLLNLQSENSKYKEIQGVKDKELREKEMVLTDLETRSTVLRNLLADHGIAVSDSDLENQRPSDASQLETQLRDRGRANEAAQREIEDLRMRCEEAEDKVESLGRLIERLKDARSPTSSSMRSPTPTGDNDRRVGELEKRLTDMEKEHREKVKAVENDYQTAVRYVKGTEKMLKRMKDELNKQKATNATLQNELDSLRGQPGTRTRDMSSSGRSSTPSLLNETNELNRKLSLLQNQHTKLQEDFAASQDVLNARNREVELLRMRVEEYEREIDLLREDLDQSKQRIQTLLEVGVAHDTGISGEGETEDEDEGSEEASMAFDKFTKELKQWERSRSPGQNDETDEDDDDDTAHHIQGSSSSHNAHGQTMSDNGHVAIGGHKRHSSEYSGDWVQ
ncbi:hypothetical protein I302_106594 [Kwoniella bestiolae CBS 10118]|uniref:Uncharacterized protein n=1 Tax=Kwoniella bestiolae CBS 10118 TaxID=1296100 RepID=A0A1B9G0Z1_9TREE|nr:hypothetical protein I302_06144 [Kwoniella bestiolae CBS 10118]OCF24683.1 hypothetical protein I302_06144 [Kwoniella bestiolae CBS 10118]